MPKFTPEEVEILKKAGIDPSDGKRTTKIEMEALRQAGLRGQKGTKAETKPRRAAEPKPDKKRLDNVVFISLGVGQSAICTFVPPVREDALNAPELAMLTDAVSDELLMHERIYPILNALLENSVHGKLGVTLCVLALPRMARHGLLPQEMADALTLFLATGGAPNDHRGHGERQEHASQPDPTATTVSPGTEVKAGQSEVPGANGRNRARAGRSANDAIGVESVV